MSIKDEIIAINKHTERIRELRFEMLEELHEIDRLAKKTVTEIKDELTGDQIRSIYAGCGDSDDFVKQMQELGMDADDALNHYYELQAKYEER